MSLIHINKDPRPRDLKWFGLLMLVFGALLATVFHFAYGASLTARIILVAASLFSIIYYALPPLRRPMFIGWMCLAMPIGAVVSIVLLALTYYLVITPVGLLVRLFSHDPMTRRFDRSAATYWVRRPPAPPADRYFRQF